MARKRHSYTQEQHDFLAAHVRGRLNEELKDMFNEHFGLDLSISQIKGYLKYNGLKSGVNAGFKKGHTPFNKGMKGVNFGGENGKKTQFKAGTKHKFYLPVGSERLSRDGYAEIKVADLNEWKKKHVILWEKENGPVPEGHLVIFGDKNRFNFDINNLILVSRKQLITLNQRGLIKDHADLTRVGVIVADLYLKIGEMKRKQ